MSLKGPSPLTDRQELAAFSSGDDTLDDWLRRRARANQASGASRTYVLCRERRAVGYYALASGALALACGPGSFRRNMPDPIPVVVLGRLAVDRSEQGRGLGRALFQDAALRTLHAAETIGRERRGGEACPDNETVRRRLTGSDAKAEGIRGAERSRPRNERRADSRADDQSSAWSHATPPEPLRLGYQEDEDRG